MIPAHSTRALVRLCALLSAGGAGLAPPGFARQPDGAVACALTRENSPVAEEVAPRDAWRLAESYAAAHPGCDVVVGSGGSMMPVYRDRTVLVVQAMPMAKLKKGMTVIFIGRFGQPVAHTLVEKTLRGWVSMGLANGQPDVSRVRAQNYIGTVIKAFAPNPAVAARRDLPEPADHVAMLDSGRSDPACPSPPGGG